MVFGVEESEILLADSVGVFTLCRHEAERLEQEARGKLERQRITDQAEAEKARKELLELEALRWVTRLSNRLAALSDRAGKWAGFMLVYATL